MMLCKYFVVFFICGLVGVQGRRFPDYTYHPEINGWLQLHREAADWQDARINCHMEGALLAADWNVEIRSAINKLQASEDQSFSVLHVGAEVTLDTDQNGTYVYLEGEPTLSNLPDGSFMRSEPCAGFLENGTMGEVDCNQKLPYVCYAPGPVCGTGNNGYTFFNKTKHCYKFAVGKVNWTEAYKTCKREGAYLAVINSNDEADYLGQLIITHSEKCCAAIGFYLWTFSNSWWTITGQTLEQAGFSEWGPSEPTSNLDPDTVFRFGFLDSVDKLYSQTASHESSYICEKNSITFMNADKNNLNDISSSHKLLTDVRL